MNKELTNILSSKHYCLLDGSSLRIEIYSNLKAIAYFEEKNIREIEIKNNTIVINSNIDDILYFLLDELISILLKKDIKEIKFVTTDEELKKHYLLEDNNIKYLDKNLNVNNKSYYLISLLGHGKGGYSYLASDKKKLYVLKQIHHEPCLYYSFSNKILSELNDYNTLISTGIRLPKMLDIDIKNERILKEYLSGFTIDKYVKAGKIKKEYLEQIKDMSKVLKNLNINIDYYLTNFIVKQDILYYIDYECNPYMPEWDFDNWGSKYWQN